MQVKTLTWPIEDEKGNRLNLKRNVFVSKDGRNIYRRNEIGDIEEIFPIYKGSNGKCYVKIDEKVRRVDYLVAVCYKPQPKDGKQYTLRHIDGDDYNCAADNLEWRELTLNP